MRLQYFKVCIKLKLMLIRVTKLALQGMCDMRNPLVQIIRPLRSFDTKELAFYNFFNNLEPITYNRKEDDTLGSIQSLIANFVHTLQANFPATITTVVKIGDKLTVDKDTLENDKCLLCEVSL